MTTRVRFPAETSVGIYEHKNDNSNGQVMSTTSGFGGTEGWDAEEVGWMYRSVAHFKATTGGTDWINNSLHEPM